jgi:hypothetical protein
MAASRQTPCDRYRDRRGVAGSQTIGRRRREFGKDRPISFGACVKDSGNFGIIALAS